MNLLINEGIASKYKHHEQTDHIIVAMPPNAFNKDVWDNILLAGILCS